METISLASQYINRQIFSFSNEIFIAGFCTLILFILFPSFAITFFYWLSLGILSAIGIGSGVPTGALYLFPFVSQVAATNEFFDTISICFLPTFSWGIGTAIGEIPPYFMANAINDQFNQMQNTMQPFIQRFGARGVFLMACYPNLTFDACGIVCGIINMPFWKFFGATLLGKAFVKAPCQSLFVVCISKGILKISSNTPIIPPTLVSLFQYVSFAILIYFSYMCVIALAEKEKIYVKNLKNL